MAEKAGLHITSCSTDRVKAGSLGLLVLWPLVKLASAIVAMHARRKTPDIVAENRQHLARMNSFAILTGRTVVLEMVRRPDSHVAQPRATVAPGSASHEP